MYKTATQKVGNKEKKGGKGKEKGKRKSEGKPRKRVLCAKVWRSNFGGLKKASH